MKLKLKMKMKKTVKMKMKKNNSAESKRAKPKGNKKETKETIIKTNEDISKVADDVEEERTVEANTEIQKEAPIPSEEEKLSVEEEEEEPRVFCPERSRVCVFSPRLATSPGDRGHAGNYRG